MCNKRMANYVDHLVEWLHEEKSARNLDGFVFGLSGGVDSAVVSFLLAKADLRNSFAVMMPCHSHESDLNDAKLVLDKCHLDHTIVDLSATHSVFYDTIGKEKLAGRSASEARVIDGNVRARLRMTTLYAIAQARNALVVGTDNQVEWQLGYFTKYGDGGVDVAPLIHLMKDEVYELARYLGVPQSIIDKKPSGGLWEAQTDEDEIGLSYDEMNRALRGERMTDKVQAIIQHWHERSRHKREMPKIPKAFSDFL